MSAFRKSRIVSVVTTAFLQFASYWFIYEFLQTMLNKLFRSDFYVILIGALLIFAPVLVFIICNSFFCGDNAKNCILNIVFTDIIFLIVLVACYLTYLPYDDDFAFLGLTIHTAYIIVISIIFIISYSSDLKKNE